MSYEQGIEAAVDRMVDLRNGNEDELEDYAEGAVEAFLAEQRVAGWCEMHERATSGNHMCHFGWVEGREGEDIRCRVVPARLVVTP